MNRMRTSTAWSAVVIVIVLTAVVTSCPAPFTQQLVDRRTDAEPAGLVIDSPADGASFGASVVVAGTALDEEGRVESVRVEVPQLEFDESVVPDEAGAFSVTVDTREYTRAQLIVRVSAADWNGNVTGRDITLFNRGRGPFVTIAEPADLSTYGTVFHVTGTVVDNDGSSATAEVRGVTFSFGGAAVTGAVPIAGAGAFAFDVHTVNEHGVRIVDGPQTLAITAVDWNGNSSTETVTLLRSGETDIPDFTFTGESGAITFAWSDVLYAEEYLLHSPLTGEVRPNAEHPDPVVSPYTWDGLRNGEAYLFQLQAVTEAGRGADNWSALVETIPVSPNTLRPGAMAGYREIWLDWPAITGADRYALQRAEHPDGPYLTVTTTGNQRFADRFVEPGLNYYYRVHPEGHPNAVSAPSSAAASTVPGWDSVTRNALRIAGTDMFLDGVTAGDHAFVLERAYATKDALRIFDISDPENPSYVGAHEIVASAGTSNNTSVLAHLDGRVYVCSDRLTVVDVTTPTEPSLVGTYTGINDFKRIVVKQVGETTLAYTTHSAHFRILDVTNPSESEPVSVVSSTSVGAAATDLTVDGTTAVLAFGTGGIRVYDVTNPSAPVQRYTGLPGTTNHIARVELVGNTLYSLARFDTDSAAGVVLFDLSDPTDPAQLGRAGGLNHTVGGGANLAALSVHRAEVDGFTVDLAAVSDSSTGVHLFDTREPAAIHRIGQYSSGPSAATRLDLRTGSLFAVAGYSGIWTSRVEQLPTLAPLVHSRTLPESVVVGVEQLATNGTTLAILNHEYYRSKLRLYDVSDPANPVSLSSPTFWTGYIGLAWQGDDLLTARYDNTLAEGVIDVIDASNPLAPVLRAPITGLPIIRDLKVAGDILMVAAESLHLFDLSVPAAPRFVATVSVAGSAMRLAVSGSTVYVFSGDTSGQYLNVVDVSNPNAPQSVQTQTIPASSASPGAAEVLGETLYSAHPTEGVRTWNVSAQKNPVYGTRVTFTGPMLSAVHSIVRAGGYIGVSGTTAAGQPRGVFWFDAASPTIPRASGLLATEAGASVYGLLVTGDYLFVANAKDGGLRVYDLSVSYFDAGY